MLGSQTPYILDIINNQDDHNVEEISQDLYDGFINTNKLWYFKHSENNLLFKYSCFERFDFCILPVHSLRHSKTDMFMVVEGGKKKKKKSNLKKKNNRIY